MAYDIQGSFYFCIFGHSKNNVMKFLFFICMAAFLFSCNCSSRKNDPNKVIDDTARMNNPAVNTTATVTIQPVKIIDAETQTRIKVKGKVQEAWKWNDKLGENILIISYVAPHDDKGKNEYGEEGQTAEILSYHFAKKDWEYAPVWIMNETEKSCPFDITCEFIKGSTTITDLDKDGIAEVVVQYRLACRSDVSPAEMKLLMHEDTTNYYLKGLSWIKSSEEDKFTITEKDANLETLPGYKKTEEEYMKTFGRYESEKGFAGAPPEFLAYARQQWMKFVKERFE